MPLVLRFGPSILINGVAPYLIYFVLHHQFQVADLPALLATSIPPLLNALVGIVRWRRIDFLAGFVLFTISLAVALVALGGDPRLYLIRESFITAGIGLAFILSNSLPRPLGFFFARYFMAGNDRARVAWVNDRWQGSAGFRHAIRFSNLIRGLGFVLEAVVRTYLVFTLSTRGTSDRVADRVLRFLRGTARLVGGVRPTQTPGSHARPGSSRSRPRQLEHPDSRKSLDEYEYEQWRRRTSDTVPW